MRTPITEIDFESSGVRCNMHLSFEDWFAQCKRNSALGVNFLHLNIRSIRKHWDSLILQISDFLDTLDVLILSEIACSYEEISTFEINGWNRVQLCRENKGGGGLVLFYNAKKFNFSILNHKANSFESISGSLELVGLKDGKKFLLHVFALYRPPSSSTGFSVNYFLDELNTTLDNNFSNGNTIMLGDTNIDLESKVEGTSQEYEYVLASKGLEKVIKGYTREEIRGGSLSKTAIDHIYVRNQIEVSDILGGIVKTKISDHYPIGAHFVLKPLDKLYRPMDQRHTWIDEQKLMNRLSQIKWQDTMDSTAEKTFLNLIRIFEKSYDDCKKIRNNSQQSSKKRPEKQWMTRELRDMTKERDRLFRVWKSNPANRAHRQTYNTFRNRVNREIKLRKNEYYKIFFDRAFNDPKRTWTGINQLLGRGKKKNLDEQIMNAMMGNNTLEIIVKSFASQFKEGLDEIKHNCNDKKDLIMNNNAEQCFYVPRASERIIKEIIKTININKSAGIDGIRYKDLQSISKLVAPVLVHGINLSLKEGKFPECLKTSVVRPIHKKGPKNNFGNYRPIAILPAFGKIFEKYMSKWLHKYLRECNLISEHQYAYQKGKCIEDLLKEVGVHINAQIYKGCWVLALFIDLSKAFETINYKIMFSVLEGMGIVGPIRDWFITYLKGRKYKVKVSDTFSSSVNNEYGVPQGSVLGPILFLMYINAIYKLVKHCKIWGFADDILIISSHKDFEMALKMLQEDFNRINRFLHDMDLILNAEKTVLMNIYLRNRKVPAEPCILYHSCKCKHLEETIGLLENIENTVNDNNVNICNCKRIAVVEQCQYLGVIIDSGLTWKDHIIKIQKKLFSATAAMYKITNVMDTKGKITIYKALIESLIRYGVILYGTAAECHLNRIRCLQEKCLHILLQVGGEMGYGPVDLFGEAGTLSPKNFYYYSVLKSFFYDKELRVRNNKNTTLALRQVPRLKIPQITTNFGERLPEYIFPTLMNRLPENIFQEDNFEHFRCLVYEWLMQES